MGHQVTRSPGHQVTSRKKKISWEQLFSSSIVLCHVELALPESFFFSQVTRSPGHQVTRSPGHANKNYLEHNQFTPFYIARETATRLIPLSLYLYHTRSNTPVMLYVQTSQTVATCVALAHFSLDTPVTPNTNQPCMTLLQLTREMAYLLFTSPTYQKQPCITTFWI